jgi:hypothetical protein
MKLTDFQDLHSVPFGDYLFTSVCVYVYVRACMGGSCMSSPVAINGDDVHMVIWVMKHAESAPRESFAGNKTR